MELVTLRQGNMDKTLGVIGIIRVRAGLVVVVRVGHIIVVIRVTFIFTTVLSVWDYSSANTYFRWGLELKLHF